MHTITNRAPKPDELRVIQAQAKPDVASFGCLVLMFGILPGFLLGKLGAWIGRQSSPPLTAEYHLAGWLIGFLVFVFALFKFLPYQRHRRKRARSDASELTVQEISVTNPRVFELFLVDENEPILAFDIGDDKILYLQGQWLRDAETYGAVCDSNSDPEENIVNGLAAPFSFPSSAFTLTRLPHSKRILKIIVQGAYLPPEKKTDALRQEYDFRDSELFEGQLEDLTNILARAYAKQATTRS